MQVVAIVVSLAITVVAVVLAVQAIRSMLAVIRLGQPEARSDRKPERWKGMLTETLAHTRMLQWKRIGVLHWFVFVGFITLSSLVATAYGQIFVPTFALPVIGHWIVFEWWADIFSWLTLIGIVGLIVVRQRHHPAPRVAGAASSAPPSGRPTSSRPSSSAWSSAGSSCAVWSTPTARARSGTIPSPGSSACPSRAWPPAPWTTWSSSWPWSRSSSR